MNTTTKSPLEEWVKSRYGLFIHFGLFSLLGRGEWVRNKDDISPEEYRRLADRFNPCHFDAEAIADLAVAGGMQYLVFTTMHCEGFRMYDSRLSDFNSVRTAAGRDFTAEIVRAARKRGLKIALYHALNNWHDRPDAVDALEGVDNYKKFIDATHARLRELVEMFPEMDVLWYDAWWPFDASGWKAEEMNAMVRRIKPSLLVNGRNGLLGDFATPEQQLSMPKPWRPWEACVTLNDNWGFHAGDENWKSPVEIIKMLACAAQGRGNLLLNIGPDGEGRVPLRSIEIIRAIGTWLKVNGECIFGTDLFTIDFHARGEHQNDWCHHGPLTARGNYLYLIATSFPGEEWSLSGFQVEVKDVHRLDCQQPLSFVQSDGRVTVQGSGRSTPDGLPVVFRFTCKTPPRLYRTGGMRDPITPHPRYDPLVSDLLN